MLTKRQIDLFGLLGYPLESEREIRKTHKNLVDKYSVSKSFTRWLEKCLTYKWKDERRTQSAFMGD